MFDHDQQNIRFTLLLSWGILSAIMAIFWLKNNNSNLISASIIFARYNQHNQNSWTKTGNRDLKDYPDNIAKYLKEKKESSPETFLPADRQDEGDSQIKTHNTINQSTTVQHPKDEKISPPMLSAKSYLVKVFGEKKFLLEKSSNNTVAPASITKLMTALILYNNLLQDAQITISKEAKQIGGKQSSAQAGETFKRDEIIKMMLVHSANDAAFASAQAVGKAAGKEETADQIDYFVSLMNKQANDIGMTATNFTNPTGLDAPGHLSTAHDLALLAEYIWKHNPSIWKITRIIQEDISSLQGKYHKIINTNSLLSKYSKIIGGKTGFTDKAGESLLFIYQLYQPADNYLVVSVLLHSQDRSKDGQEIINWLEKTFAKKQ